MISDFKIALTCVYIGVVVGIPLALLLLKLQPQWRRPLTGTRSLIYYILGLFFCALMSAGYFAQGRPYLGGFFASFATIALFVSAITGLRFLMRLENGAAPADPPSWVPDGYKSE